MKPSQGHPGHQKSAENRANAPAAEPPTGPLWTILDDSWTIQIDREHPVAALLALVLVFAEGAVVPSVPRFEVTEIRSTKQTRQGVA